LLAHPKLESFNKLKGGSISVAYTSCCMKEKPSLALG